MRGRRSQAPRRAALAGALLVCAPALAGPLPEPIRPAPLRFEVPRPRRETLPNGVAVYLLEDRTLPAVSVGALFRAGSADDPPGLAGLAEVTLEAMRSGGAGERDPESFEDDLADLAAVIECAALLDTSRCDLWSLASSAPGALEQFADLLRRPRLAPAAVRTARERRAEEARREEDDPETVAEREFNRLLFAGHAYGNWPTVESVSAIRRRDVGEFHRSHLRPSRLILYAAGNFEAAAMRERLAALFGDWREPAAAAASAPPGAGAPPPGAAGAAGEKGEPAGGSEPAPGKPRTEGPMVLARPLAQTSLILGHAGPRWDDPDLPALEVLSRLLSYYRYYLDVRDTRGLAYDAYASFSARRLGGVLEAYAGTRAEATRETLRLMRHHLEEVAAGRFTDEEAAGARDAVAASFVHRFSTAAETAERFAQNELRGRPVEWLLEYGRRVAAVTSSDLRRVAREHLRPQDLLTIVVGDPHKFGSLEGP